MLWFRSLEDTDKKSSAQECYEEILMYDSSHSIAKEKLEALNTTEANQESLVTSTRFVKKFCYWLHSYLCTLIV